MFKKVRLFLREYQAVGLVAGVMIASGGLYLLQQQTIANVILGVTAIAAVIPLMIEMIRTLKTGSYGVDILAATAIITAVLLGEFWAAIIVVLMVTGGESLEDYAESRAKTELTDLLQQRPKKANLLKSGKVVSVSASQIQPKDKIKILLGEVVPADCEIIEGESTFDESSLTGESLPVDKGPGDQLLSGSINNGGVVVAKVSRKAKDSQYEQIIKLVRSATQSQAPFVRMADRYAVPFTIIAYLLAGTVWAISGDPNRFLQVLVVATPCPLILGAPIALISGMSRSAKHGIIIKNGTTLEQLASVDTMAFDKTGTLTIGKPVVQSITTYGKFKRADILQLAGSLEQNSNHGLAKAIVAAAQKDSIKLLPTKGVKESAGLGVSGRLRGKTVQVGNWRMIEQNKIKLPARFNASNFSRTAVMVVADQKLAGVITFQDEVRPEAQSMLKRLKSADIHHVAMITGDNHAAAKTVADQLDIREFVAEALPADKIIALEKIDSRPVAFVGDGVNDAPVLTAADVGIALGARGSATASESADVVIMQDNIEKVAEGVEIAQRTFLIARQSVLIGITISLGLMVIFASGRFTAVQGALVQEVVDIIVIFNALRAHRPAKSRPRKTPRTLRPELARS